MHVLNVTYSMLYRWVGTFVVGAALAYSRWRTRKHKPQDRFRIRLADNSPAPFKHLSKVGMPGQPRHEPDLSSPAHPYDSIIKSLMEKPRVVQISALVKIHANECVDPHREVWISTAKELDILVEALRKVRFIALDTEHHSLHSYLGFICLLQISTGEVDYVIDALALHDRLGPALRPVLSDPEVLKVMHGSSNDLMWLQRDFHLYAVNVIDTEKAAQALGLQATSLAALLRHYLGVSLDKRYQKADWRRRPLPRALLDYARSDVTYLLHLAAVMLRELGRGQPAAASPSSGHAGVTSTTQSGRPNWDPAVAASGVVGPHPGSAGTGGRTQSIDAAVDAQLVFSKRVAELYVRCQRMCLALYAKPDPATCALSSAAALLRRAAAAAEVLPCCGAVGHGGVQGGGASRSIGSATSGGDGCNANGEVRGEGTMTEVVQRRVYAACVWRDEVARSEDEGVQAVLPDSALLLLATSPPSSAAQVVRRVGQVLCDLQKAHRSDPPLAPLFLHPALRRAAPQLLARLHCADQGNGIGGSPPPALLLQAAAGAGGATLGGGRSGPRLFGAPKRHGNAGSVADEERRARMIRKFSTKSQVYENCRMLSRDGELLCFCDSRKLAWYVGRGLAARVSDDPPTIRLLFEHRVGDQVGGADAFYSGSRANRCVVCGEEQHYLRYRVVPVCYRRHFPSAMKSHRSHDVLLLCVDCHQKAHQGAERLKREIAEEYGIPLQPHRLSHPPRLKLASGFPDVTAPQGGGRPSHDATPLGVLEHPCSRRVADREDAEALELQCGDSGSSGPGGSGAGGMMHSQRRAVMGGAAEAVVSSEGGDDHGCRSGAGGSASDGDGVGCGCGVTGTGSIGARSAATGSSSAGADAGAADAEGDGDTVSSHTARRCATALLKAADNMPAERRREMEQQVRQYIYGTCAPPSSSAPLLPWELHAGLVAGLAPRKRRKVVAALQRWPGRDRGGAKGEEAQAAGEGNGADAALGSETAGDVTAGGEFVQQETDDGASQGEAALRLGGAHRGADMVDHEGGGHMRHGRLVVQEAMRRGGEGELDRLAHRFRQCFVASCAPRFLPPAWEVSHTAHREFGDFSVYSQQQQQPQQEPQPLSKRQQQLHQQQAQDRQTTSAKLPVLALAQRQ